MDFCSKFGYDYGFEGSDSEEISDDEIKEEEKKMTSAGNTEIKSKAMKKVRKGDTNLIGVRFDELVLTQNMFAGDPIRCKACEAVMSETSQANLSEEGKKWTCEYCYESNDISAYVPEQIPSKNDVTFLVEPAPTRSELTATVDDENVTTKSMNDNHLGYCIDVSGSMDTNIPVKNDPQADSERPRDHRNEMTRLTGVKAACLESIEALKANEPNKRVALVTFSDTIKYYGDTSKGQLFYLIIIFSN